MNEMNDRELLIEIFASLQALHRSIRAEREANEGRSVGLPQDAMADAFEATCSWSPEGQLIKPDPEDYHAAVEAALRGEEEAESLTDAEREASALLAAEVADKRKRVAAQVAEIQLELGDEDNKPWNDDLNPQ